MSSIVPLTKTADYPSWLGYAVPAQGPLGQTRHTVLDELAQRESTPPEAVAYRSEGRLLVIGPEPAVVDACAALTGHRLQRTLLLTWWSTHSVDPAPPPDVEVIRAHSATVDGHLGHFDVTLGDDVAGEVPPQWHQGAARRFDLVLDLRREPDLNQERLPPGYFAPRGDAAALARALEELPGLTGEFQKPRYFDYDPAICAHGNSGLTGCTRCLDVCPTLAIGSLGDRIDVDPYLCQGAGSCSAVCPTGAIRYTLPPPGELREQVRRALQLWRELQPDTAPAVLFHDGDEGRDAAARIVPNLPEWLLPWPVEEIGAVGLDVWLTALAHGARGILVLNTAATPPSVLRALQGELATAQAILDGLGFDRRRIELAATENAAALNDTLAAIPDANGLPARFSAAEEKRTTLRLALDHLYTQADDPAPAVALPGGAPFGSVQVDPQACTLCMACAGLCPTSALLSGDGTPRLRFIEWNCVQCGLCRSGCPEAAITLEPRLILEPQQREAVRVLHEDTPFECVVCGKPFATRAVMERMAAKLKDHWMFQSTAARRRLQMCDDCRVRDLLENEGGLTSPKPHPGQGH